MFRSRRNGGGCPARCGTSSPISPSTFAVWRADLPAGTPAPKDMRFVLPKDFAAEALPSVMRKVLAHGGI